MQLLGLRNGSLGQDNSVLLRGAAAAPLRNGTLGHDKNIFLRAAAAAPLRNGSLGQDNTVSFEAKFTKLHELLTRAL
jgi:hypothetical protein